MAKQNNRQSGDTVTLALKDIVWVERFQFRDTGVGGSFSQRTVDEYAEAMEEADGWADFPPLAVVRLTADMTLPMVDTKDWGNSVQAKDQTQTIRAGTLVGVGGWHRKSAALRAGIEEAPCRVWDGGYDEIVALAVRENASHGVRRTSDEIQAILRRLHAYDAISPDSFQKYCGWSEKEIARFVGCGRSTVWDFRQKLRQEQEEARKPQPVGTAGPDPAKAALATVRIGHDPIRPILRDAFGRTVPEHLEARFRAVSKAKAIGDRLRCAADDLLKLKHGEDTDSNELAEPALERVSVRDVHADLYQYADTCIDAALPHIVCPACDGEGFTDPFALTKERCETCLGTGELVRSSADTLPPELERKARGETPPAAPRRKAA
jgi:hypothetical protein